MYSPNTVRYPVLDGMSTLKGPGSTSMFSLGIFPKRSAGARTPVWGEGFANAIYGGVLSALQLGLTLSQR